MNSCAPEVCENELLKRPTNPGAPEVCENELLKRPKLFRMKKSWYKNKMVLTHITQGWFFWYQYRNWWLSKSGTVCPITLDVKHNSIINKN